MSYLRAWVAVTLDYLPLPLTIVGVGLGLLLWHLWPVLPREYPLSLTTVVLSCLSLGLAIALLRARHALRRRSLCGGLLRVQGMWVCPMLALGRPVQGASSQGVREVVVYGAPPEPKPLPPLRVLVVEDDDVARHIMVRSLEGAGFEVEATEDGAHALYILGHQRPDVMVLDLMLPTLDGAQVARAQRALEASYGRSARIVVVTGRADATHQTKEFSPEAVLIKPVDGVQLVRAVTGLAPVSRLVEEAHAYEPEPRNH